MSYIFFKKRNFKNFVTINSILNSSIKFKLTNSFLFVFYFNKTKSILKLLIYNNKNAGNLFYILQNCFSSRLYFTKIVAKYSVLKIVDLFNKYTFLKNTKTQFLIKTNNLNTLPKNTTSSIYKNINLFSFGDIEFQFLRKNKVYNKGRYSRCRQNYRTGVYLCMYLSVASIFGLYY
jgi:hypothetical protein